MPYTRTDGSYYWVDDSNSAYYNQFVSTDSVAQDWTSAEHFADGGSSYDYVLALDYNASCTPDRRSSCTVSLPEVPAASPLMSRLWCRSCRS